MSVDIIRAALQRPIAFHRILAEIGQSATAGLFMSQALYWSDKGDGHGTFWKKAEDWYAETLLSRRELEVARQRWRDLGVLTYKLQETPPKTYYTVNYARLYALIDEHLEGKKDGKKPNLSDVTNYSAQGVPTNLSDVTNLYNTETTTENTSETTGRSAPAPVPTPPRALTVLPSSAMIAVPMFVLMGKKAPNSKGLSLAPDSATVQPAALDWAVGEGYAGDLKGLQRMVDTCLDFRKGKGERRADWAAEFRSWIRKDIGRAGDTPGSSYGQGPNGGNAGVAVTRPRYGYNEAGEPTNRATALASAAEQLERKQRARRMAGNVGEDAITLSDDEWREL